MRAASTTVPQKQLQCRIPHLEEPMLTFINGGLQNETETLRHDESSGGCSCVNLLLVLTRMLNQDHVQCMQGLPARGQGGHVDGHQ